MEKKITKAEVLNAIKAAAENGATFAVPTEDVIAYVDTTLAQMANKVAKDKERAAKKRAEDTLLADVEAALTDEAVTAEALVEAINKEDVTKMKVVNRLATLVKNGVAVKEKVKTDNGERTVYKLA